MKRFCIFILILLTVSACGGCGNEVTGETSKDGALSETVSETQKAHEFNGNGHFDNLSMRNGQNKMGDTDGPAYCVYSNTGFNGASFDIQLSALKLNLFRRDAGHVNAYIFLGTDVYHPEDGYWINCVDAGLCNSGDGWHVFYNLYSVSDPESTQTWYESGKILPADHDFRLTLDSSSANGHATLTVYDITADKKADGISFELKGAERDGSNTAYLTDFALDYPDDLKKNPSGGDSEDFAEITLYNTDCGIYMNDIRIFGAALYKDGESMPWTSERTCNRGIWPDADIAVIDYACTAVRSCISDTEYIVDLDLNRKADRPAT